MMGYLILRVPACTPAVSATSWAQANDITGEIARLDARESSYRQGPYAVEFRGYIRTSTPECPQHAAKISHPEAMRRKSEIVLHSSVVR